MGSRPVKLKQIVKVRKSKAHFEKSLDKSSIATESPNCELLLAYYASESSMNKKIKALYETIFAHEEQEVYEINLSYMNLDVKCTYHVKIILHFFINLQDLRLSRIGLNSKNLKRLSRSLPIFTKLCYLHLDGNRFETQGISVISSCFKFWPRLIVLNLSDNNLSSECFEMIAENLVHLQALNELMLNSNYGRDNGAFALQGALASCERLQILGIASNSITYHGIKSIFTAESWLQTIDISNNHISRELAFLFTAKYENIQIII